MKDKQRVMTHFADCVEYAEFHGNPWVFVEVRHLKTALELLDKNVEGIEEENMRLFRKNIELEKKIDAMKAERGETGWMEVKHAARADIT